MSSLPLCVLFGAACREPTATRDAAAGGSNAEGARALTPAAPPLPASPKAAATPSPAALPAAAPLDLDPRLQPVDPPLQHLAFTPQRLGQLTRDELIVRELPSFRRAARVAAAGARNLVSGVGGDLLAAGQHVYRLAALDEQAELLAPVPRLGPTTILPASDSSDHFWLQYEGIHALPEFDLQETVLTPFVSVLSWTELADFDGRALASLGEGSFVYTTPRGLRRRYAQGEPRALPGLGEGERIWRLLFGAGGLWLATREQLRRLPLDVRALSAPDAGASPVLEQVRLAEQFVLPAHPVALASSGRELAVLSVESLQGGKVQLRIEVHAAGSAQPRVLQWEEPVPQQPDAGADAAAASEFAPELALAPGRPWVAAFGYALSVFDWRTGLRLFPRPEPVSRARPVQNLAPRGR